MSIETLAGYWGIRPLSRFSTTTLFSREAIFSFVLRAIGWNEINIYSIFTIEYRFERKKSPNGKSALQKKAAHRLISYQNYLVETFFLIGFNPSTVKRLFSHKGYDMRSLLNVKLTRQDSS